MIGDLARTILWTFLGVALWAFPASSQVAPLPANNFMASPAATTGYLAPRSIVSSDLFSSCPVGQIFYNNSGSIGCLSTSGGSVLNVSWVGGIVSIATPASTPSFTIAGTSGGIPYFSSGTTWASSSVLTANSIMLGGGAGAAPTTPLGLGTTTQVLHGNAAGAPLWTAITSADIATALSSPTCIGCTTPNTVAATALTVPSLPGLSTAVTFPSAFSGAPSFGLALPSAANPWVIAATSTSPATDNPGGLLYVAHTESQALQSVTISNASPAVVTLAAHGITAGKAVAFLGTLGSPLTASTVYYVCVAGLTANTFQIGTAKNGNDCSGIVNTSGASSGVTMATNQGLPGTSPSTYGYTQVTQGSIGNYNGALGYIYNGNTMASQPLGVASAIGSQGIAVCGVVGCSADWGGLFAIYDTTGSGNPANPQTILELDHYGVGTDATGNRVGLLIGAATPAGVGTPPTVTNGILIGGPGQYGNVLNMGVGSRSVNGVNLLSATFTGSAFISNGFSVDYLGDVFAQNLSASGLSGLAGALNLSGSSGAQPTLSATNAGTATSYTTPGFRFLENEGYTFLSTQTHFGFSLVANKNASGSTTAGSRQAFGAIQSGAGGTPSDYFTGGFEIASPCNSNYGVTCNSFNLGGNFTGNNPYVWIPTGMAVASAVGEEVDVTTLSTSTVSSREGIRIADIGSTVQGSVVDAAIDVVSSGLGFKSLLSAGDVTGNFSLSAGGTFITSPATTVALSSLMNFSLITGVPTIGGIVLGANVGQTICWGTTSSCVGGFIASNANSGGGGLIFTNGFTAFQFGGVTNFYAAPFGSLHVPVAFASLPACSGVTKGYHAEINDQLAALSFNAAANGGGSIIAAVRCNGAIWVDF